MLLLISYTNVIKIDIIKELWNYYSILFFSRQKGIKMSKKALILTLESYQDHEVVYPFYRVQEEGFEVDIMANKLGRIFGILGTYNECTQSVFDLDDKKLFDNHIKNPRLD